MSFGSSIGDAFAIIGAIERIVNEVRAYQSAPLHFQRLAIELGFLSSVCKQVFELRPSLPDELQHIERIRAIAMQCLGPLQDFEAKMAKYENTLGTHRDCIRGKRRRVESIKGFGKQLHWSAIAQHDVNELRAILTSEILAINTLLTMIELSSLESQNFVNQTYLTQLRTLIRTTNDASTEIKRYLVDCKLASEKLESLITSGNMTQQQQTRILKIIENKTNDTRKAVCDLSRRHQHCALGVREAIDDVSSQIVKLFSFKGYMEDWIRQIVQFCKDIIAMVERNTQILLSLHGMMTKLSVLLSRSNIQLPILEFENPFGHTLALPYQLCDTWNNLHRLLLCMFFDKPGLKLVEAGRFLITNSNTNRIIKPNLWSTSIAPGDKVFMSMVLERIRNQRKLCPRCSHPLPILISGGAICQRCRLWSSTADDSNNAWGISEYSSKLSIPIPPPEEVRLQGSSWKGSWTSIPMRKQITRRVSTLSKKRRLEMLCNEDVDVSSRVLTDDEIEKTFRRVHVVAFQGDPLEALVKIGQRCRDLMVMFFPSFPSSHQSLSSPEFKDTFSSILADLEEIRNSGITPMAELDTRRGSAVEHMILETYLQKTATILENAPLGDIFSYEDIQKLVRWLQGEPEGYVRWSWRYGSSVLPPSPHTLAPDSFHTLNFHKYPISSLEEIKLEFSSSRRAAHGQPMPIYGRGRRDIDWRLVATSDSERPGTVMRANEISAEHISTLTGRMSAIIAHRKATRLLKQLS
ncbi:hypothetical protein GGR58DRAFT_520161 [Xylaria digitata]|nr:hypothetical protein GGR58DRAFT_520161 [Xylaria digitata]